MDNAANYDSSGFLGIIIEDKENLSGPAHSEVILMISLEILISIIIFISTLYILHIYCFLPPPLISTILPSGLTKGNQVTMGHNKEIIQSSSDESNKKHGEFTFEKVINLMYRQE